MLFIFYLEVIDDGTITSKFILYFNQLQKNFKKQISKVDLPEVIEDRFLPPDVRIPIRTPGGKKSPIYLTFPRIKGARFGHLNFRFNQKQQKILGIALAVLPLVGGLAYQYLRNYLGLSSNLTPPPVRRVDLNRIYKKFLDSYSNSGDSK